MPTKGGDHVPQEPAPALPLRPGWRSAQTAADAGLLLILLDLSLTYATDASGIEQMRAPTASHQSERPLRRGQQRYRDHRQRDRAGGVEPHRRQFLGAVGIGTVAGP